MSQRLYEKSLGEGIVAYVVTSTEGEGLFNAILWDEDAEAVVGARVRMTEKAAIALVDRGFKAS